MKYTAGFLSTAMALCLVLTGCASGGSSTTSMSETPASNSSDETEISETNGAESTASEPSIVESSSEGTTTSPAESISSEPDTTSIPYEVDLNQPSTWTETLEQEGFNLTGIESVRTIEMITGDGSPNKTREKYQVGGTDLGVPAFHNGKLYLFFGDTFRGDNEGHPMAGGGWRSNVLAYSTDTDFSDGLTFDGMIVNPNSKTSYALELIRSKKIPGDEHTVIPTGALSANGALYSYFMSVREWGAPGDWSINYGGLAKSTDDGQSFEKLVTVQFDGEKFGQIAPVRVGEYLYLVGIGGGRKGAAYLMRVLAAELEDMTAYEYFSGMGGDQPQYSDSVEDAEAIVQLPVGEPSIMYNEFLEEFVLTYLDELSHAIVMRVAKNPWGPWSDKLELVNSADFPGLYGGFVHESMTSNGGETLYMTMSMWDPVYNSLLVEVKVKR